ncbi:MAG: Unknown protein [uncultured Sulfurovum sp.]|uniref:Outer membrane protein beta-barrel domain-containing protein n=1 Tax=uncultured Sulfurovum sp. TaxID=269237 RepID=A0A6S6SSB6_9BACT|nr:MAG: Unknown protein [uncultured Sulfurovum sp.]
MKRTQLSLLALIACTHLAMAGGDITPYTAYEIEDVKAAEIITVTPVIKTPIVEAPIVQTPIVQTPVKIVPAVVPVADVSPVYLGLGLVAARYDSSCDNGVVVAGCDGVDKTGGLLLRAGYDVNQYVGVEARGLATTYKANGGKIKHFGIFAKPQYPVTNNLNLYGLGGFAKTTTSGSLRQTDVSGLAFGAGLEYDLSDDTKKDGKYDREFDGIADQEKGLGVFADYERLYYKSGAPDLDAVSVGVTYDF